MPILCESAVTAGDLITCIGGQVRGVDSLTMAARMLDNDPAETLVVIGPEIAADEALAFAAHLRLARPWAWSWRGIVLMSPCCRAPCSPGSGTLSSLVIMPP